MFSGKTESVKLWCKRDISEQVLDRFGENIFITDVTEEGFKFKVDAVLSDALVTWIINYGDKLKVESPTVLKDMVKKRAREVLALYEE